MVVVYMLVYTQNGTVGLYRTLFYMYRAILYTFVHVGLYRTLFYL